MELRKEIFYMRYSRHCTVLLEALRADYNNETSSSSRKRSAILPQPTHLTQATTAEVEWHSFNFRETSTLSRQTYRVPNDIARRIHHFQALIIEFELWTRLRVLQWILFFSGEILINSQRDGECDKKNCSTRGEKKSEVSIFQVSSVNWKIDSHSIASTFSGRLEQQLVLLTTSSGCQPVDLAAQQSHSHDHYILKLHSIFFSLQLRSRDDKSQFALSWLSSSPLGQQQRNKQSEEKSTIIESSSRCNVNKAITRTRRNALSLVCVHHDVEARKKSKSNSKACDMFHFQIFIYFN